MKKNWFFILLLSIAALSLAGTAAYFSVFGISKLFLAAGMGIVILASSLEFAKLVTVSYVYRFWKTIKKGIRWFYIFAVCFIMLLTSIGIYGFLTSAYQKSANKIEMRDSQIKIADSKRTLFVSQLDRINKTIESDNSRINNLSNIRGQQERRLDTLYNRKQNVRDERKSITGADDQIKFLNGDITEKMKQASSTNDSIAFYDQKIVELKSSDVSNEVGPYKFVSDLTGIPMNKVVNIVAILIILVFDPLAIALLIGVNQLTMTGKKPEEEFDGDVVTEEEQKEKEPVLNKVKKLFKKGKKKEKEKEIEPEIPEVEPVKYEYESTNMYDLFKDKEKLKEPPTVEQLEFPINWEKTENTENTVKEENTEETVSEKKTLVGNDFSKDSESDEDEKEYEERLEKLTNVEPNVLVFHEAFGRGKILEVYPNHRIKVKFDSGEIKELNVDFANLQQIWRTEKDWFDKYTEDEVKKKVNEETNIYFQEKIIDGKSVLEFTTDDNVEHTEEIPFINIKIEEPEPEQTEIMTVEPEPVPTPVEQPKPIIPERYANKIPMVKKLKEELESKRHKDDYYPNPRKEMDDDIQSLTFGNTIKVNPPDNTLDSPRLHFTKDRKARQS